jgi:predicted enzyme related to lactoylglutathione lyase
MTEVTRHEPGEFCWAELATTDAKGAKDFYTSLFGWTFVDNPMGPEMVYTRLQLGGKDVAALYTQMKDQREQGIPPNWMCYVAVASADETAKKATELGGKVLQPAFDVMDFGRMAVLQGPEGAVFSIWQAGTHTGAQRVNEPGAMCWCELWTRDPDASSRFYQRLFGWTLKGNDPSYLEIQRGGKSIGGIMPMRKGMEGVPPAWGVYFMTADCDATAKKAASLRGGLMMGPQDIENVGRFAVVKDPQGAAFSIFQPKMA